MRLPEELMARIRTLPCWPSNHELQDLDAIELIVRHCANVCGDMEWIIGWKASDDCSNAILSAFGLEDR